MRALLLFLGILFFCSQAVAGQNAVYFVDDRWDGSNENSLPHFRNPSEACVVGVMERKVRGYQEGSNLRFRYRGLFVGEDDGIGIVTCRGVIEKQLYIVGANWVSVEAVDTVTNGPFGTPEACSLAGYTDGQTGQCGPPKCDEPCCCGGKASGSQGGTSPSTRVGNPIDTASGNKHQSEADYVGAGAFPIRFERSYDSSRTWFNNPVPMGIAWMHSYLGSVQLMPGPNSSAITQAVVYRPGGGVIAFNLAGGVWAPDNDIALRLSVAFDADGVPSATLTTADDAVEQYDIQGRLVSITNRDGFVQTLNYTTSPGGVTTSHNDVQLVSDPQGHTLTFGYNPSGQLTSLTDGNGATVQFTYDAQGNLATAVYPDVGSTTQTRTYKYNEAGQVVGSWPNALTGIVDEKGQRFASWGYDSVGRAVLSVHGPYATGTIDKTALVFNANGTTTVTDALGQARTYGFTVVNTVAHPSALDVPCDTCAAHDQTRGYDSNGYSDASTDFNGNSATYAFAALDGSGRPRGLETQRVEGIPPTSSTDTSAKRTVNTQWHSVFHVPIQQDVLDVAGTPWQTTKWVYNARGQVTFKCLIDPNVGGASGYLCGSQANGPSGVRQWAWTYCESGGGCPIVGLLLSTDGPRTDVSDATTYSYYPTTDLSGCATGGTCHYLGDLQSITNALGHVISFVSYDGNGRPTRLLDANAVPTDFSYHPRGWILQRAVRNASIGTSTGDRITSWTYDEIGETKQVTQPAGDYKIYGYDIAHRLTDVTNRLNEHVHFQLDDAGDRKEEDYYNASNALKHKVLRDFDTLGRLADQKNGNASQPALAMSYTHDGNGNVQTATDGRSHVTVNSYDPRNRLVQTERDSTGLKIFVEYAYDPIDHLVDVQDPQGLHTHFKFDGLDNLKVLSSPDTGVSTYNYDAAGNKTGRIDARNVASTYAYDALNRRISNTYPATPALNTTLTWDIRASSCSTAYHFAKGHLARIVDASGSTQFCFDRYGETVLKTQAVAGSSFGVGYTYTKDRHPRVMTEPNGTTVTYAYDNNQRSRSVSYQLAGQSSPTTLVSAVTYNPFGPVSKITYGNGRVLSRTYDLDYVVKGIADASTVGDGLNLTISRDAVSNLTQIKFNSTTGDKFIYDGVNRLTQVNDLSNVAKWRYTYDNTGNRLTSREGALPVVHYTYDLASHHLLDIGGVARTPDAAGNTLTIGSGATQQTYHYDDTGRMDQMLVGGSLVKQYLTDAQGQRVQKSKPGDSTQTLSTVYDEDGRILGNFNATGATVAQYRWLDDLPIGVLDGSSTIVKYIEPDHLGTPRTVIDPVADRAVWNWSSLDEPFGKGQPTNANGSTLVLNLRFPGQFYDSESGMNYNMARDYDSISGRYLQTDPVGFRSGGAGYSYASSSPIRMFDPLGLFTVTNTCPGCKDQKDKVANDTQKKVQDACNNLGGIGSDALKNCLERRCKFGHVIAECDTNDCYNKRGYSSCLNDPVPLSDAGEVHLCRTTPEDGEGGYGGTVIHEWAHTCNWAHGDGLGVPDNHPESDDKRRCLDELKPGFVW